MKRLLILALLFSIESGYSIAQYTTEYSTWIFNASIYEGFSSRPVITPAEISLVNNKYPGETNSSGRHYGINLDYLNYTCEPGIHYAGVGIKYNKYVSNSSTFVTLKKADGSSVSGILTNNISEIYVAPSVSARFKKYRRPNYYILNISFGLLEYTDEAYFNSDKITIKANSVALMGEFGYEVSILKHLAAIITISVFSDFISAVKYTGEHNTVQINHDSGKDYDYVYPQTPAVGAAFSLGLRIR